jgi:hypothetical protein
MPRLFFALPSELTSGRSTQINPVEFALSAIENHDA